MRDQCEIYNAYQTNPNNVSYPSWITYYGDAVNCAHTWEDVVRSAAAQHGFLVFVILSALDVFLVVCCFVATRVTHRYYLQWAIYFLSLADGGTVFYLTIKAVPFSGIALGALGACAGILYTLQFPPVVKRLKFRRVEAIM